MLGLSSHLQAKAMWRSCVGSAFRTTLACSIVALVSLYGPLSLRRHISLPAFSYVTVILVITDATLGDTLQGCWLAFYASIQSLGPAILSLWLIGPARLTSGVTALAVALGAFVVMLPGSTTHLVSKRIALGQIVLVYVIAFINGAETDPIMHPIHVAASTALGVFACVFALLLPFPRLASYQVKNKSQMYAVNASQRLKLFVNAFCAQDRGSAASSIAQAKSLSVTGQKLLQVVKNMQPVSMGWERLPFKFLRKYYVVAQAADKFQDLENVLRGLEISSLSNKSSSGQIMMLNAELKEGLEEHLKLAERQVKRWLAPNDSAMVPEFNTDVAMKSLQTLQTVNPTVNDLPSLFFLFCFKLLHRESISKTDQDYTSNLKTEPSAKEQKTGLSFLSAVLTDFGPSLGITKNNQNLMAAFRCSLSLGMAVFLGLIYSKPDGYWAGLPVAISLASARDATFRVANLKAHGTVLGTVYAVLICYAFPNSLPLKFVSLVPWFIFTSFLRKSRMYGQAGGLSAIIGAVLILGRKGFGGPKEFAIARIVETFIGLSCSVVVDILFHPTRASTLAKVELTKCMSALQYCVSGLSLYASDKPVSNYQKRLRGCVNELSKCIGEAEAEPHFWFLAFNSASYTKLKLSLTKAVDYLQFGAHAIHFLQEEANSKLVIDTWKGASDELANDIKVFAGTVSCLVKCFEDVSKVKSLTDLEKINQVHDIEIGKAPSVHLKKLLAGGPEESDEIAMTVKRYIQHMNDGLQKIEGVEGISSADEVRSQVMVCLGALGFCMDGLAKEVREIVKAVKDIIHWENPTSHIDLYDMSCKMMNTSE